MRELNALETCLLIDALVREGQEKKAHLIATSMTLQEESKRVAEAGAALITLENKIFDLVLNLNKLNDVKGDLDKIQETMLKSVEDEREINMKSMDCYMEELEEVDCGGGFDDYDDEYACAP